MNCFDAEEAFITNSLIEIVPVTSVDGKLIGNGRVDILLRDCQNHIAI